METFNLSKAEYEIMEFLWEQKEAVTLQDIMRYCGEEKKRSWKQQTVYTFLSRMEQKGVVSAVKKGQKRYYSSAMSIEELKKKAVHQFLEENFNGSLKNFLSAFAGGKSMTEEEKGILKEFLDE